MADETTVTTPATPAAPTLPVVATEFTRTPIAVTPADAKPAPVAPATDATKPEPQGEAALISALAKANAELRSVRKAESDYKTKLQSLETELGTTREGSSRSVQLEAQIADMLNKPRKYFELYKAKGENKLAEILESFASEDAPENEEVVALRKRLDEKDAAERKAKEDSEKARLTNEEKERLRENQSVNEWVTSVLTGDDGKVEDDNGVSRWALISDDPGVPERARLEALDFAVKNKLRLTAESRLDLIRQALDQMEADARADAFKRAEKLKLKRNNLTTDGHSFTLGDRQINDRSSHSRAIDSSIRRELPPPNAKPANTYAHGFTRRD